MLVKLRVIISEMGWEMVAVRTMELERRLGISFGRTTDATVVGALFIRVHIYGAFAHTRL